VRLGNTAAGDRRARRGLHSPGLAPREVRLRQVVCQSRPHSGVANSSLPATMPQPLTECGGRSEGFDELSMNGMNPQVLEAGQRL